MFDFASGNTTQSGLHLAIASHLAHSVPPAANPANARERNYCLRSIFVLQHLQGCIVPASGPAPSLLPGSSTASPAPSGRCPAATSRNPARTTPRRRTSRQSPRTSASSGAWRAPTPRPPSPPTPRPLGLALRLLPGAPGPPRHGLPRPPEVPVRHQPGRQASPEALQAQRRYWMPFLFIQFVHETIPCLLNHPFLLSMRLRHFRHTMPVHFIQQSFESMNRTAGWVIFFLDVLEKKSLAVSDPVVAHCVVVVATIHLQHSFVQDPVLRSKAKTGFDKCMGFLRKTGAVWPCVANMASNLRKLQDSVVIRPPPDRGDHAANPNRSFSIDAQLLWDLLVYDRAGRPDAGRDQSLFGPTLRSDADDLAPATDAADFDLVGSAGISAHKAVPNQAAVYAPDEDIAPVAVPESATPAGQSLGDAGPSFEDIFFEGAGPFGTRPTGSSRRTTTAGRLTIG
ncbi:C6 transcription factor [Colletotrichum tofieldiae]|nr:C6 transcription factor [Colletotrichum tofieldiae]